MNRRNIEERGEIGERGRELCCERWEIKNKTERGTKWRKGIKEEQTQVIIVKEEEEEEEEIKVKEKREREKKKTFITYLKENVKNCLIENKSKKKLNTKYK